MASLTLHNMLNAITGCQKNGNIDCVQYTLVSVLKRKTYRLFSFLSRIVLDMLQFLSDNHCIF